jgi:hypothetical protein
VSGGTRVTLVGGPFVNTTQAVMRLTAAGPVDVSTVPLQIVSSTVMVAVTPPLSTTSLLAISVSFNGVQFTSSALTYFGYGA